LTLDQHLVPNNMNLIRPEHPLSLVPRDLVVGWISLRPAFGSLSGRRDHELFVLERRDGPGVATTRTKN
jgi:hypothetical protein